MLEHLPALQVVVPLVAAPLIVLLRGPSIAWGIATVASFVAFAIAVLLALRFTGTGVVSYAIGSWPPPWGIEYRVDALSAFMLVLVAGAAALVMPYARRSVIAELPGHQVYLFYAMYCLCVAGLLGMTITGDMFNVFVFLEISSLSTYVLIALGRGRRALLAAFQYLIVGTIGATFYVIGIGLLYLVTGSLNFVDVAARLENVQESRPILAALAFITVGLGLKLALFPLHQWLPNAYAYAPSVVTTFLAATATKVSVYLLVRYYFLVFSHAPALADIPIGSVLVVLSLIAIVAMSLVAVFQPDLKRMFAYSSVAQIGYITLGIGMGNSAALTGSLAHLVNHGVTKGALFLLAGGVALRCGDTSFDKLRGLARRMPWTSFGIVVAGLSLIGAPATAGFTSKWYLIAGALEHGQRGDRWPGRRQFADRRGLRLALRRGGLPRTGIGAGAARRAAVVDGRRQWRRRRPVRRSGPRHDVQRRFRAPRRRLPARSRGVTPESLATIAPLVPVFAAVAAAASRRRPNLRGGVSLAAAVVLIGCVAALVPPVLAGARPEVRFGEVLPGLALAFRVEPFGLMFALIVAIALAAEHAVLDGLPAGQRRSAPGPVLRVLRAFHRQRGRGRLLGQPGHAVPVLRGAHAGDLAAGHAPRGR